MLRVIIRCAGSGDRWADYLGVPKHLAPLCGEPLLTRTVRLIGELAADAVVLVVVSDLSDRRYLSAVQAAGNPNASRKRDRPTVEFGDVDKIASSIDLADPAGPTLVVFGDVWWSRPALARALAATRHADRMLAIGRIGADGGGELFGFVWPHELRGRVEQTIATVISAELRGDLDTAGHEGAPLRGGWAFYRAWHDAAWDQTGDLGDLVVVDDWTDDLDEPDDWDRWCWRYAHASDAERAEQV